MEEQPRLPEDTRFKQQQLKSWAPKFGVNGHIAIYFVVALLFIPLGEYFRGVSNSIKKYSVQYDGDGTSSTYTDCKIDEANADSSCTITMSFDEDVSGPFYLYYEIDHFYQNHRRYVKSVNTEQMMGSNLDYDSLESDCYPITSNGSMILNPCGLIANTFFNDVITISPGSDYTLDTDGIAWSYDEDIKFKQVDGFTYSEVDNFDLSCTAVLGADYSDCRSYNDSGVLYYYWYPDEDTVQYLYETFDGIISPIKGVTDEHFINWMRTAGLSRFQKLYGKIDTDFLAGENISFDLTLNFEVNSFGSKKSLVLSNLGSIGGKNIALGYCYIVFGWFSLIAGVIFAGKRVFFPRPLGDIRQLSRNEY